MMMLLRCVARAVMENGIEGLAKMVPGGEFVHKVAAGAWKKYREKKQKADDKKEIEALAQANFEQARQQAVVAVREAMEELAADRFPRPAPTKDDQERLELYLSQLPATAAQSLKRPEDPTGRTARPNFALDKSDDVERLLPARAPRFRLGAPLPGKPDWVLERPLGVGGFGEVWLARHKTLTALNGAVKFFHGQQARDLQHESALINRVMLAGEHDNIVKLTDVSLTGDVPWLMYEYVPGGDLTDLIREWQRRGFVGAVVTRAFDWLHNAGAILAEHPVQAVRLTTMPSYEWTAENWNAVGAALLGKGPRPLALDTLEIVWPGIEFTLPAAGTSGTVTVGGMTLPVMNWQMSEGELTTEAEQPAPDQPAG